MNKTQSIVMTFRMLKAIEKSDISPLHIRQILILFMVYADDTKPTIKNISKRMDIPKASVHRATEYLISNKLITKAVDPSDRRIVIFARTAEGVRYLSTLSNEFLKITNEFMELIMKREENGGRHHV